MAKDIYGQGSIKIRVAEQQRTHIVTKTTEVIGSDIKIMLFSSRVDDLPKGGDIDLYITPPP